MRVSRALGLVLLMAIRLLPVAAATSIVEVVASRGDIRSGPSAAHEIMGEIRHGEKYAALEKRGEWYRIPLVEGWEGWIHEKLVTVARSVRLKLLDLGFESGKIFELYNRQYQGL